MSLIELIFFLFLLSNVACWYDKSVWSGILDQYAVNGVIPGDSIERKYKVMVL